MSLLGILLISQTAIAKDNCDVVTKACDAALAAKNKALSLANLTIQESQKQIGALTLDNETLRDSATRWYHNPIVMFVFGAAAGTLTYVLVKK